MNKRVLLGYEFHFGIGFLNELIDGTGIKLEELGTMNEAMLMPKLMFYSLVYSYKREQKAIDFTQYTIFDLIEDNGGIGGEFWTDFGKAFHESMYKDVPVDNSKKKAIAKK